MEIRFDGRVALITGSSQGTGRAYAQLLAERGAKVVLNSRTPEALEEVAREIRAKGGTVAIAAGDVSEAESCADIGARALDAFGGLDILINNAGVSRRQKFETITEADYRNIIALNLDSTFFMVRNIWPHMAARGYGRIVNTGSATGMFGTQNNGHYAASKGGVYGLTRALALDGAPLGIQVNAAWPMAATRLANNIEDADFRKGFFAAFPAERCAPLVAWLSHEDCDLTGEIFDTGGGIVSRIIVGVTKGYFNPEMTLEDLVENFGEIMDEQGYALPTNGEKRAMEVLERATAWRAVNG